MIVPKLFFDIFKCTDFCNAVAGDTKHPCNKIINSQPTLLGQNPEPWNGNLAQAPVLIISSNPSFSPDEFYPQAKWPPKMIADFFVNRFIRSGGSHLLQWTQDRKPLMKNGQYRERSVPYWNEMNRQMERLFGRPVQAGVDYCLTEIVHCKSQNNKGVREAAPYCAKKFLTGKNAVSSANIVIGIGAFACSVLEVQGGEIINNEMDNRSVIGVPAPNSSSTRKISELFNEDEINNLRGQIAEHENRTHPNNFDYTKVQDVTAEERDRFIRNNLN